MSKLPSEKCKALFDVLGPRLVWLDKLMKRLDRLGVPPDDEIAVAAREAYNAMHTLRIKSHYAGRGGVGRDPGDGK